MKPLIVLLALVLVCLGGWLVFWYAVGTGALDQSQQGRDARAAIAPGMIWTSVIAAAGEPSAYRVLYEETEETDYHALGPGDPGPAREFSADRVEQRLLEDGMPRGFRFDYRFSGSVAFTVLFDGSGTVTSVQDLIAIGELLQHEE